MEFPSPLSVTVDIIFPVTETNYEDVERRNIFCCDQCFSDLVNFLIFVLTFNVFITLSIIEIVIGIVYINECSMNYLIPIYLIVAGLLSIINFIFAIFGWIFLLPSMNDWKFKTMKSLFSDAGVARKMVFGIALLFLLFALAWFIAGNIWVYGGQSTVQHTNPVGFANTYCNRVVYLSGFWSIIVKYIFVWILICRLNCYLCFDIQRLLNKHSRK